MLSYRHAFHAGNHADVLKHLVLSRVLTYLTSKDKPLLYIDTHAGAGLYDLRGDIAGRNGESANGIGRIWGHSDLPPILAAYLQQVRACNPDGELRWYPGSPALAGQLLRPGDRMRLFERHSTELPILRGHFEQSITPVQIESGDGFAGLKGLLPPTPRRALILIDPSYEEKADFTRLVTALEDALKRFATGCYLVWYPILARRDARALPERLRSLPGSRWLDVSLQVGRMRPESGLAGSGVFVINPPWVLEADLRAALPWLVKVLARDEGAGFQVEASSR